MLRSAMSSRLDAVEAADEAQELLGGELVVEEGLVGDVAEQRLGRLGLAREIVTAEQHLAAARLEQADHHADRRRLAGAVGAEKAEDLTGRDLEVEIVHGDERHRSVFRSAMHWIIRGVSSTTANASWPMMPARAICRSSPPSISFTCVASAGS